MAMAQTSPGERPQEFQGVHVFDHALQTGNHWIQEIMAELCVDDPVEAQRALRTVLHVLRDRLPTLTLTLPDGGEEVIDLRLH